jgi:hypothetical protein
MDILLLFSNIFKTLNYLTQERKKKLLIIYTFFVLYILHEILMYKVLNSGRGHGRGRVKDFAISAVTAVALRITVVAL